MAEENVVKRPSWKSGSPTAIYQRMQQLMLDSNAFVFIAHPASAILHRDTISPGLHSDDQPVYHEFTGTGS